MDFDLLFKITIIVEYTIFSIIRIQYQRLAQNSGYKTVIAESKRYSIGLSIFICYEVVTLFIFLLFPDLISFAAIQLLLSARFIGIALGILALALFIWTHRNLRNYFTVMLRIMDGHQLIETGPYRWVRHPMYTAFYLLHIAAFLLTANWFIGITWILGLTLVIFFRIGREEKMMLEAFGDRYQEYIGRTGRFVPRSIMLFIGRKRDVKSISGEQLAP